MLDGNAYMKRLIFSCRVMELDPLRQDRLRTYWNSSSPDSLERKQWIGRQDLNDSASALKPTRNQTHQQRSWRLGEKTVEDQWQKWILYPYFRSSSSCARSPRRKSPINNCSRSWAESQVHRPESSAAESPASCRADPAPPVQTTRSPTRT